MMEICITNSLVKHLLLLQPQLKTTFVRQQAFNFLLARPGSFVFFCNLAEDRLNHVRISQGPPTVLIIKHDKQRRTHCPLGA